VQQQQQQIPIMTQWGPIFCRLHLTIVSLLHRWKMKLFLAKGKCVLTWSDALGFHLLGQARGQK
jgi:hypothetical protein